jgi:hypothetical protein
MGGVRIEDVEKVKQDLRSKKTTERKVRRAGRWRGVVFLLAPCDCMIRAPMCTTRVMRSTRT